MHAIESEVIKAANYVSRKKFADRQDYLGSVLNAVIKMSDAEFDDLSDEAAAWANAAISAKNTKTEEIPDFDEDVEAVDDPEADPEEASDDETTDEPEDDEGDPTDDNPEDDTPEDEPEEKAPPKKKQTKEDKPKVPPPVKKTTAKTPPKKTKSNDEDDVVLDKWGCMPGSKNAEALTLFEKGATTKEVKEKVGGTYYNILKKMEEKGHTLSKEGAVIKLTHKDSAKAPIKKKK